MEVLVAFPLFIVGFAICLAIVLLLNSILPRIRCGKWTRFAIGAVLLLAAMPLVIWCSTVGSRILVILMAYGMEEYRAGLWIINKHGDLSDGRSLSAVWMGIWGAAMFLSYVFPALPLWVFWMLSGPPVEPATTPGEMTS